MNYSEIRNGTAAIISNDPYLAVVIKNAGECRLRPHKRYFLSLIDAIIGQQLSMYAAKSIAIKVYSYFDHKPTPLKILGTSDEILRSLGLSNSKVKYIKDLSQKTISKEISFRQIEKRSDEEIIAELTKVKGIGVWTAHMFLIFTLCRLNVLPAGDLGIKNAIQKLYNLKTLPDEKKIISISKKYKWKPFNSIAAWYLWKSLDEKSK